MLAIVWSVMTIFKANRDRADQSTKLGIDTPWYVLSDFGRGAPTCHSPNPKYS